ncbi:DHS-like NAD/FAD-binding domain-containing protein [Atractiella rhizophila]|nr:DHS-like NAD/FAD-binding domain-containing protein [Atractiella rhizophila]
MSLVTRLLTQNPKDYQDSSTFFLPNYISQADREELDEELKRTFRAIAKAKRIAVVCGAGISTGAGIPDFRSSAGLFESLKVKHPEAKLTSGKDLFDASLFKSETNTALFYNMVGELKKMSDLAEPTTFHKFLKELDDKGKLFRVYTQNIDALEAKVGLTYGLPAPESYKKLAGLKRKRGEPDGGTWKPKHLGKSSSLSPILRRTKSFLPTPDLTSACSSDVEGSGTGDGTTEDDNPYPTPSPSQESLPPASQEPSPSQNQLKKLNRDPVTGSSLAIPRCIPLHGHLNSLTCTNCSHTMPLETPSSTLDTLLAGEGIVCALCSQIDSARAAAGERSRGVGRMKPDIVLYGEEHQNAEEVGDVTRRDLLGVRPDLLIVAGTTLKVPGTKLLVKELAKVIRPPVKEEDEDEDGKRRGNGVHIVLVNNEFPTPGRDFKDVFDTWIKGDVQQFVKNVEEAEEEMRLEKERKEERKEERRIKKEEKERMLALDAKMGSGKKGKQVKASNVKSKKQRAISAKKTTTGKMAGKKKSNSSITNSVKKNKKITDMLQRLPSPPSRKTTIKLKVNPSMRPVVEITVPRSPTKTPALSRTSSLTSLSSVDVPLPKAAPVKKKPTWEYVIDENLLPKSRYLETLDIERQAKVDGANLAAGAIQTDAIRRSSRVKAKSTGDLLSAFGVTKPGIHAGGGKGK